MTIPWWHPIDYYHVIPMPKPGLSELDHAGFIALVGMERRLKRHDLDVYSAQIIWDGAFRTIKVNESETQALIGIGLLYGYEVCIETIAGGMVKIMNLST
jgi:hypothetical protein